LALRNNHHSLTHSQLEGPGGSMR